MSIFAIRLVVPDYDFTALGEDRDHAYALLTEAWDLHCEQTGNVLSLEEVRQRCEAIEAGYYMRTTLFPRGVVLRDENVLAQG